MERNIRAEKQKSFSVKMFFLFQPEIGDRPIFPTDFKILTALEIFRPQPTTHPPSYPNWTADKICWHII